MSNVYIKKPLRVHAFKYGFEEIPDWMYGKTWLLYDTEPSEHIIIHTLEGDMRADKGDYIIRGINGEIYPCKADIFQASYDKEN
ncbi:MAG: hypothetical protein KGI25_04505 [Thaumarchaeota archaeon]|nr:hypothetical protein [Nitrososphaerota archaeon]